MTPEQEAQKAWENRIRKRAYRSSDLGPKDSISIDHAEDLLEDFKASLKAAIHLRLGGGATIDRFYAEMFNELISNCRPND